MNRINWTAEGDSLTQGGTYHSIVQRWRNTIGSNAFRLSFHNAGVNGATLANLAARWGATQRGSGSVAQGPGYVPGALNILTVQVGPNDFSAYTTQASRDDWLTRLAAYFDIARSSGWVVIGTTVTPRNASANHNTSRDYCNPLIKAMVGVNCHAVADFGGDSIMGPEVAAADALLYPDGLHPSTLGSNHLGRILEPVLESFIRPNMSVNNDAEPQRNTLSRRRFRILHG